MQRHKKQQGLTAPKEKKRGISLQQESGFIWAPVHVLFFSWYCPSLGGVPWVALTLRESRPNGPWPLSLVLSCAINVVFLVLLQAGYPPLRTCSTKTEKKNLPHLLYGIFRGGKRKLAEDTSENVKIRN